MIQEAALYVQEGEDDAKFYQHPNSKYSKLAYDIVHYPLYHILHLVVAVLLMLLAFAETPAVGQGFLDDNPDKKKTLVTVSCELTKLSHRQISPLHAYT